MGNKIKFYTDEHIDRAVARGLRERGAEVLRAQEADMLNAEDIEHLKLATAQRRVTVSQDEDFLRLHAQGIQHTGIAYATQRTSIGDMVRGLMLIHDVLEPEDMRNHVEFL